MGPADFLALLHSYTEQDVELRSFTNERGAGPSRQIWTRNADDIAGFIERYDIDGRGTFFGVATRRNGGGKIDDTRELPALFMECDGHRPVDVLKSCPMPPSIIVESGGGIHAYWRLNEPYDISDVVFGEHYNHPVMCALAGLARVFNGDRAVVDLARVLRLPGTTNSKRAEPAACRVIHQSDVEYDFTDLEEWLSWQRELVGEPIDPFIAAMNDLGIKPPMDVKEMLDGMVYGENVHDVQLRVTANLQASGQPEEDIVERIITATRLAVGQQGARWDWKRETVNVRDMVRTARAKFGAPPVSSSATVVKLDEEREKRTLPDDPIFNKKSSSDDEPVCTAVARSVVRAWPGKLMSTAGELLRYDRGVWKKFDEDDDAEMMSAFQRCFDHLKASASPGNKQNCYRWVVHNYELIRRGVEWDARAIIVANNGVYDIHQGNLRPHSPDDYATRKVNCDIDPDARCPVWLEFLNLALDQETISVLQEWFGAAFVRGKRRELTRALFLHGGHNTGKTQVSAVLMALMSSARISSANVSSVNGEFGLQQFIGATGWIADDAVSKDKHVDPEMFKILVTGEKRSVNRKNMKALQTSFDFPVCLTCNHLPRVNDNSNAVYSRSIVIPMNFRFNEETAPPEETKQTVIRDELAGVINWALEGWQRLNERGYFDLPEHLKHEVRSFRDRNTPTIGWIRECLQPVEHGALDNRDIVASLAGYCAAHFGDRERPPKPQDVYETMREMCKLRSPKSVKGYQRQVGVHLNEKGLAYWEEATKKSAFENKGSRVGVNEVNRFVQKGAVF